MSNAGTTALVIIGAIIFVGVACLIVGLPVYLISKYQDERRTRSMNAEERAAYMTTRKGFKRFSTSTPVIPLTPAVKIPVAPTGSAPKALGGLISLAVLIAALWYFYGGGVEDSVAHDAIDQYNIAKRSGTPMDACIHAGIVRAAYLQAKDETQYREWKITEAKDCSAAGMPQSP